MKVSEILNDESKWTRGALARDADRTQLFDSNHPGAVCWCMYGACKKAAGDTALKSVDLLIRLIAGAIRTLFPDFIADTNADDPDISDGCLITRFNDTPGRSFADVQAVLTYVGV